MIGVGVAALVGLAVGLAVGWGLAARSRRDLERLGERVSKEIEPLLRRRAAEVGVEQGDRPVWTRRHSAAEKVEFSAGLARELTDHARGKDPAHSNTALAQTEPAVDSQAVTAPRAPAPRRAGQAQTQTAPTTRQTDEDRS